MHKNERHKIKDRIQQRSNLFHIKRKWNAEKTHILGPRKECSGKLGDQSLNHELKLNNKCHSRILVIKLQLSPAGALRGLTHFITIEDSLKHNVNVHYYNLQNA